ncbi:fimbria/pilus periplasmic chaperone [Sphaerospermopsis aphanizomenoides BCCUSP55]|uniref:fimbrial biogenesis chaperone n=1 Tax=Sphaerospermopsis aphanizomenoides TaxID=459663 RepID=UPI0019057746|nr:fimbria/pilus periplasmic chaperone [Sphaerospermopsis aphanizomenoides]MBK1986619.1 fimbria/pilus periplasmic chaperone [Sphaerospermopsis aphanizomenoides BCCUSP55]
MSLLTGLGLNQVQKAWGSNFQVSPVQVSLSSKVSNQVLTVHNDSNEPLRFQLKTYAWSQDAKGEMQLAATEDIVAFPGLFPLNPGEQRSVRVGTLVPVGAVEKTYRIFVEELPPPKTPNKKNEIRVLTKLGIPIFLQPSQQVIDGKIENINISNSHLYFHLKNTGNTHFVAQKIRVKGLDGSGKSVFDQQRNGWYILAGISQPYALKIPTQECNKTQTLVLEVKTNNKVLTERSEMPKNACTASK